MTQEIKKPELKKIAKKDIEKIFFVIPEFGNRIEKKEKKKKIQKESRLFKKQKRKKIISIDKVKRNIDTKISNNSFAMR